MKLKDVCSQPLRFMYMHPHKSFVRSFVRSFVDRGIHGLLIVAVVAEEVLALVALSSGGHLPTLRAVLLASFQRRPVCGSSSSIPTDQFVASAHCGIPQRGRMRPGGTSNQSQREKKSNDGVGDWYLPLVALNRHEPGCVSVCVCDAITCVCMVS